MEILYKKIPWYWKLSPFARNAYAGASNPYVLLSKDRYEEVLSGNPSLDTLGIIEHEKEHIRHQQEIGKWKLSLYYFLSPKFRLEAELRAERARFSFVKSHGGTVDLEERARRMSGMLYAWMISYEEALHLLEDLWARS